VTLEKLPSNEFAKPRLHSWDPKAKYIQNCPDGNERTERTCRLCQMVKITVHAGDWRSAWREWRTRDGKIWGGTATPPCLDPPQENL